MNTIDRDNYNGKYSAQGWPLGRYSHRIGTIRSEYADNLCRLIGTICKDYSREVYSLKIGNGEYRDIIVLARMGINEYSRLVAFLNGFKAGLNA